MKRLQTAKSVYSVLTPGEVKQRLVIDFTEDDEIIADFIDAATDWAEMYMGRSVLTQSWDYYFNDFSYILIPDKMISNVVITYFDENNAEQTLDSAEYYADLVEYPASITCVTSWPATYSRSNAVKVSVESGFLLPDSVPGAIKTGIALIVGHLYNNRENTSPVTLKEIPMGAKSFLDKKRVLIP